MIFHIQIIIKAQTRIDVAAVIIPGITGMTAPRHIALLLQIPNIGVGIAVELGNVGITR